MLEHEHEASPKGGPLDQGIRMDANAIRHALRMQAENQDWQGKPLRLYIEGKGCDGFYYGLSFDRHEAGDFSYPQTADGGLLVVVDCDTIEFVDTATITWVDDERGQGFLVENPRHRQFRGKFYKRQSWQEKLQQKIREKQPNASADLSEETYGAE